RGAAKGVTGPGGKGNPRGRDTARWGGVGGGVGRSNDWRSRRGGPPRAGLPASREDAWGRLRSSWSWLASLHRLAHRCRARLVLAHGTTAPTPGHGVTRRERQPLDRGARSF